MYCMNYKKMCTCVIWLGSLSVQLHSHITQCSVPNVQLHSHITQCSVPNVQLHSHITQCSVPNNRVLTIHGRTKGPVELCVQHLKNLVRIYFGFIKYKTQVYFYLFTKLKSTFISFNILFSNANFFFYYFYYLNPRVLHI